MKYEKTPKTVKEHSLTHQMQQKVRMDKKWSKMKGLHYGFLKNCWAEYISKLIAFVYNAIRTVLSLGP